MSLRRRRPPNTAKVYEDGDHNPDDYTCDEQLPLAAALRLNPIEVAILDVARCFCFGSASGNVAPWAHAFDLAEERLGPVDGPAFVARVIALMRAILRGRPIAFGCMPVGCCHISKDEQTMMTVVRNAFRGDDDALRAAVGRLVTTQSPARILLTAQALCALCLQYESVLPAERARITRPHRTLN
jgi:hypothetical protein